ncbi:MAG: recombinase family protein [Lachnospiraceae bacterium]
MDGILTGAGKPKWRPESVKKILKNEKYIGDALLQKTYTVDVLTKKRVKNKGIVPQYYVENSHDPIIPRDLYMQVQEEMLRRSNLHSGANQKNESTVANMHIPVLSTVRNAERFTAGLLGTIMENTPSYGDA